MDPIAIIIGVTSLIVGVVAGKLLFAGNTKKKLEEAEIEAKKMLADAQTSAEALKKEKLLEAKEKFVQLKAEHDKEILERNKKVAEAESRIRSQEQSLNSKSGNLDKQMKENEAIKENLTRQLEVVSQKKAELDRNQEEHVRRLEKIATLTADEARAQHT